MLLAMWCPAQPRPVEVPKNYNFIFYNNNDLRYDAASPTMKTFFEKWRRVTATHQGNVNIVQFKVMVLPAKAMSILSISEARMFRLAP